jgi:kynurenine formamidase
VGRALSRGPHRVRLLQRASARGVHGSGISGRGVLLDAERYFTRERPGWRPDRTHEVTPDELRAIAAAQDTELRPGDILLLRTGWMRWYSALDRSGREEVAHAAMEQTIQTPGFAAGVDTARFLWDSRIAAAATDTSTFEAWPHRFVVGEYLHMDVLALLGIPIGELWFLDDLAADCAADGVYEFLLTSSPLNIAGGVGSPPNALAIK